MHLCSASVNHHFGLDFCFMDHPCSVIILHRLVNDNGQKDLGFIVVSYQPPVNGSKEQSERPRVYCSLIPNTSQRQQRIVRATSCLLQSLIRHQSTAAKNSQSYLRFLQSHTRHQSTTAKNSQSYLRFLQSHTRHQSTTPKKSQSDLVFIVVSYQTPVN